MAETSKKSKNTKKTVKTARIRKAVQAGWGLLQNAHLAGFVTGHIYSGALKHVCVPGMNCYSCPGALGACPIGAVQAVLGSRKPRFAFYAFGFLAAVGVLVGRFVCGWLCLFGLIEELLYRIPTPKLRLPPRADRILRFLKYILLAVFVVLFPVVLRDEYGISAPAFCKWICPVGMLEGGIPLLVLNKALRPAAHFLWAWKFALLVLVLAASIFIQRPFCRYMCPLGAFYGLFHRIGFLRLTADADACVGCGACARTCPMGVDPSRTPDSAECIRCGACVGACPANALRFSCGGRRPKGALRKPKPTPDGIRRK